MLTAFTTLNLFCAQVGKQATSPDAVSNPLPGWIFDASISTAVEAIDIWNGKPLGRRHETGTFTMFRRDGKRDLNVSEWDRNRWVNGPTRGREIGPGNCRDNMGLDGFVAGREVIGERL